MLYESTRGSSKNTSSSAAIKMGIAPDGGLFVPNENIQFSTEEIHSFAHLSYQNQAMMILKEYLSDFSVEELNHCIQEAYNRTKFSSEKITVLKKLNRYIHVLELWHGPTCAFKDMALQILPHLLVASIKKTGDSNDIIILVATSGDTGKAALEGFKDVPGTKVIVFFPREGVSEIQRLQMITQEGKNLDSIAINGNFDDAQSGVKELFSNKDFNLSLALKGYSLSSANSINWGRLVPQIVYYFSTYGDMIARGEISNNEAINFVVPSGNFGNILAAYYAKKMGLPIHKLICASNENNVLTEFIKTGVYNKNKPFHKTNSPSMDILISSNLERLLYDITNRNSAAINQWMGELNEKGIYQVDKNTFAEITKSFWAESCDNTTTLETIQSTYRDYHYVCDTHTAVALNVYDKYVISTGDLTKTIVVSTASPYKFNQSVAEAILGFEESKDKNDFELLDILSKKINLEIPPSLKDLDSKTIIHNSICNKEDMEDIVSQILS